LKTKPQRWEAGGGRAAAKAAARLLLLPLLAAWAGCGPSHPPPPPAAAAVKPPPAAAAAASAGVEATNGLSFTKSVFIVGKESKDPFFPASGRLQEEDPDRKAAVKAAAEVERPAHTPDAVAHALRDGFQGVLSAGGVKVATINNVILEEGRETRVPVRTDAGVTNLNIRCIRILRNGVILAVPGQSRPLVITNHFSIVWNAQ